MGNKEVIALVQAGDLEGATAMINKIMAAKRDAMVSEAKSFMAAQLLVPVGE